MKVLRNPWKLKQKDEMRKYFEIVYDSVRKEIYEKWNFCGCMKYIKLLQEYEIWMFLKSFTKVLQKCEILHCITNISNMKAFYNFFTKGWNIILCYHLWKCHKIRVCKNMKCSMKVLWKYEMLQNLWKYYKYIKKVNCRVNAQNMKSIKCYRSTKFIVLQNLIQLDKPASH